MFQLTPAEARALRFQIGTSSEGAHGGRRYLPSVFTQERVAMLSSVLKSPRAVAATVVRAGAMRVKIHEPGRSGSPGTHIDLTIPAAVVYLGMDVLPLVLEDEIEAEIRADLRDYGPAVAAALRELEDAPDAVLVDVRDASESVRITKEGRSLEIQVDSPDGRFEITLPAGLLGRIAREIA